MEGVIIRYKFVYINNLLSTTTITILECGMKQRVIFKQKRTFANECRYTVLKFKV